MKTTIIIAVVISSLISVVACNNEDMGDNEILNTEKSASLYPEIDFNNLIFTSTYEDLTEADTLGLLFMREEEKLAHDVYVYFYEKYYTTIFDNISEAETNHTNAIIRLLDHYGINDPASETPGVFVDPEIQSLYNEFITTGDDSLTAALLVGALIEETDIVEIQTLIDSTEVQDIITVYSHLLAGSTNHLRAFVKVLLRNGITYVPEVITEDELADIMATNSGGMRYGNQLGQQGHRYSHRNGRGSGGGNGNGSGNGN